MRCFKDTSRKGLDWRAVNAAAAQFSQDALGHSQPSLQHAYALDPALGTLSTADGSSRQANSEEQGLEMPRAMPRPRK